jgi:hypothetical protein
MLMAAAALMPREAAFAEEEPRSIYVSARGGDNNDGRSEEGAYKTLGKAFSTAARGEVKTITVVGRVDGCAVKDVGEMTLIGKGEGAGIGAMELFGGSTVRIERLAVSGRVSITGGAVVTLGEGVKVSGAYGDGVIMKGGGRLVLEKDAEISNCGGVGIYFEGGEIILKDNAVVSNCRGGVSGSGVLTMAGEAKIVKNIKLNYEGGGDGGGVYLESGVFDMSGNAIVEGNAVRDDGGGVYIRDGSFVMRDNAAVTGNAARRSGGGVYITYPKKLNLFMMQDNAAVSRNEAQNGGGVLVAGGWFDYDEFNGVGECVLKDNAVISENKGEYGGGIFYIGAAYSSGGVVTMRGDALVKNNIAAYGGGVCAGGRLQEILSTSSSSPKVVKTGYMRYGFVMEGGSIEGNAADFGAGVCAYEVTISATLAAAGFTFNGGKIVGNRARDAGGGVYQATKGAFVQNGEGIIADNEARRAGGENVFVRR